MSDTTTGSLVPREEKRKDDSKGQRPAKNGPPKMKKVLKRIASKSPVIRSARHLHLSGMDDKRNLLASFLFLFWMWIGAALSMPFFLSFPFQFDWILCWIALDLDSLSKRDIQREDLFL
jgi:hypothetical protein